MRVIYPIAYGDTGHKLAEYLQDTVTNKVLKWAQTATSQNDIGIRQYYHKVEQLDRFKRAGLNTPLYTRDLHQAMMWEYNMDLPVIGRTLRGTQGQGIQSPGRRWRQRWSNPHTYKPPVTVFQRTVRNAWKRSEWWSVLEQPPFTEYRFHIVNGKGILRAEKVHTYPNRQGILPIRNRKNGWTFIRDSQLPTPELREVAKRATAALEYPWGAVDLLYHNDTGRIVVLEVNSAPGMDNKTAMIYAKAIKEMVQNGAQ